MSRRRRSCPVRVKLGSDGRSLRHVRFSLEADSRGSMSRRPGSIASSRRPARGGHRPSHTTPNRGAEEVSAKLVASSTRVGEISAPAAMLTIAAITSSLSDGSRGSSRRMSALCGSRFTVFGKGFSSTADHGSDVPHEDVCGSACREASCSKAARAALATVGASLFEGTAIAKPAFSVSAGSSPRRMQCWHSTPINRAPRSLAMS